MKSHNHPDYIIAQKKAPQLGEGRFGVFMKKFFWELFYYSTSFLNE